MQCLDSISSRSITRSKSALAALKLCTKLLQGQSSGSLQLVACSRIHYAKDIDITTVLAQSFIAAALRL